MVEPEEVQRQWDRRAAGYDARSRRLERGAVRGSRDWICAQATGRTLEVAVGTGLNLPRYADDVQLVGLDLSPRMLAEASRHATGLGRTVELREGDAGALPFPDGSFDTVVCTLALCVLPDRAGAIAEMYRVLRPGGRLLLLDHLEPRWIRGRPATLAIRLGFATEVRRRLWLGTIERFAGRKPEGRMDDRPMD